VTGCPVGAGVGAPIQPGAEWVLLTAQLARRFGVSVSCGVVVEPQREEWSSGRAKRCPAAVTNDGLVTGCAVVLSQAEQVPQGDPSAEWSSSGLLVLDSQR